MWEHDLVNCYEHQVGEWLEDQENEGWELITVLRISVDDPKDHTRYQLFFKRPKK